MRHQKGAELAALILYLISISSFLRIAYIVKNMNTIIELHRQQKKVKRK